MSFTIKCEKCGSNATFTSESKRFNSKIEIDVDMANGYGGGMVNSIDIYCENWECNNSIEINCR